MTRYIIRRLLQAIPLLFFISLILFILMQNMGDPLATMGGRKVTRTEDRIRLARQLGLDKPIMVQYLYWLVGNDWAKTDMNGDGVAETPGLRKGVLRGDWGISLVNRQPVTKVIGERLSNTLLLMVTAEVIIILGALLIGIYSALHQYTAIDNIITATTFVLYSMPVFFFALLTMYLFSVNFRKWGLPYLPTVGMFEPSVGQTPTQVAWHMILPVATLSFGFIAGYSRYIRSTMLETLGQDYVRTAKAKGLPHPEVIYIHALKECCLAYCHTRRTGFTLPVGRSDCHRAHIWLAWHGSFIPGSCFPVRYCCSDGHHDDDRRCSDHLSDHRRCNLRLARPTHPL